MMPGSGKLRQNDTIVSDILANEGRGIFRINHFFSRDRRPPVWSMFRFMEIHFLPSLSSSVLPPIAGSSFSFSGRSIMLCFVFATILGGSFCALLFYIGTAFNINSTTVQSASLCFLRIGAFFY